MTWFAFPKRSEYVLRSLCCLARARNPLSVHAIATCQGIPESFLAKILYQLTWQGLVHSKRGPGGGFTLAVRPEQILVQQVLESFRPPTAEPIPEHRGDEFSRTWERLWAPARRAVENLTLADLIQPEEETVAAEPPVASRPARVEAREKTHGARSRRRR
jgi:Rrf2 family protein